VRLRETKKGAHAIQFPAAMSNRERVLSWRTESSSLQLLLNRQDFFFFHVTIPVQGLPLALAFSIYNKQNKGSRVIGATYFHFRRAAVLNQLKSKCGLPLGKDVALRVTLILDGTPIASNSQEKT
jgi:hypothetical protein